MVFSPNDIKHLEVVASLKDRPKKELVKVAAATETPELSLDEKLLKLCSTLRSSNLTKSADGIENLFLAFKTSEMQAKTAANVHMYRVHDEDGEDMVDRAHPQGDKTIADASGDLGDVETIVSQYNKIKKVVVDKEPTGKLASYVGQCKIALGQDAIEEGPVGESGAMETDVAKAKERAKAAMDQAVKDIDRMMYELTGEVLDQHFTTTDPIASTSFRVYLTHYKGEFQSMKGTLDSDFRVEAIDKSVELVQKFITQILARAKFDANDNINTQAQNKYSSWFYYLKNVLWSARALMLGGEGSRQGSEYHMNHGTSQRFANLFSLDATSLHSLFGDRPANSSGLRNEFYNRLEQRIRDYKSIANKLVSLNRNMHVSEIMKLQEWRESEFLRNEKVETIMGLVGILNKDRAALIEQFKALNKQEGRAK